VKQVQLWDRGSNAVVLATLLDKVNAEQLIQTEAEWRRFHVDARERGNVIVPEHNHCDWSKKARDLKLAAYRCLGISFAGQTQGLVMVSLLAVPGRSTAHKGKPVLYVKYIESAPWNLKSYAGDNAKFGWIGTCLIRSAIAVSMDEEFRGRIALHSLPQAEPFYGRFMENLGLSPDVENLRYFELSEDAAATFSKEGTYENTKNQQRNCSPIGERRRQLQYLGG
jgi:hypothetical protein